MPVGADEYARESTIKMIHTCGAEKLAGMLLRTPDKQSSNLIATGSMV